jgi:hypothetical protein
LLLRRGDGGDQRETEGEAECVLHGDLHTTRRA